jgi:hypothetical protein
LRVKKSDLEIDDEFPSGEKHYTLNTKKADEALKVRSQLKEEWDKVKITKGKEDLDYLLSETISPSKSIVDPNLPISGLKTKESPSLIKTLSPAGASKSIRYISPSQLYNFDDKLSIYGNYSKVKKISQSNKNLFKEI